VGIKANTAAMPVFKKMGIKSEVFAAQLSLKKEE
jgi:hypothetical protein